MVSTVLGVLILARNGDRTQYLQDPYTYAPSFTESTALGAVRIPIYSVVITLLTYPQVEYFQLGSYLKSTYLDSSFPLHILDMPLDPSHPIPPNRVHVHAKPGGEGAAIFDSGIALLQGMFPPTPLNKVPLANGTTVIAPLGGYQYVPVEMATEGGDRVFEPWINCKVSFLFIIARDYLFMKSSNRLSRSMLLRFMLRINSRRLSRTRNPSSDRSMTTCSACPRLSRKV